MPSEIFSEGWIFMDPHVTDENRVFGKVVLEGFSGSWITNMGSIKTETQLVSPKPMKIELS